MPSHTLAAPPPPRTLPVRGPRASSVPHPAPALPARPTSDADRERAVLALVAARAWHDPAYRARLAAEPAAALRDEGLRLAPGVEVRVLQDAPGVRHLVAEEGDGGAQAARLAPHLPLAGGGELRLVRPARDARCLVLPQPPAATDDQGTGAPATPAAGTVTTYARFAPRGARGEVAGTGGEDGDGDREDTLPVATATMDGNPDVFTSVSTAGVGEAELVAA